MSPIPAWALSPQIRSFGPAAIEVVNFLTECALQVRVLIKPPGEAGRPAFLSTHNQEIRHRPCERGSASEKQQAMMQKCFQGCVVHGGGELRPL